MMYTDSPTATGITGTYIFYDNSDDPIQEASYSAKTLLIMANALKAIETILIISKAHILKIPNIVYKLPKVVCRTMFCLSGYLSKRIRNKKKDK